MITRSEDEEEISSTVVFEKIGAAAIIVVVSTIIGFLPLFLSKKLDFTTVEASDESELRRQKKSIQNVLLSFLLNLGGGVLLANCFCHWLPEVREGIAPAVEDIDFPIAELIMSGGFFFICFLEELIHHFLHPHKSSSQKEDLKVSNTPPVTDSETEFGGYDNESQGKESVYTDMDSVDELEQIKEERTGKQLKSAIRTLFIISALSFHSVVEGLALSLEDESAGVWMNTGATALHKFVISFSIGVELIANKVNLVKYCISTIVFSIAPAVGVTVGIALKHLSEQKIDEFPLQVLQGLATGTVIYVVFFEIFPKAKSIGGTGFQHVLSMALGFAIFLPSLYFHSVHEHGEEDGHDHHATMTTSDS